MPYTRAMAQPKRPFVVVVLTDLLGILLLIGVLLFGWIPGPGGVPLLLGGLALLSLNHEWARRLLLQARQHGNFLFEFLFPDNKIVKAAYDALGAVLIAVSILILNQFTHNLAKSTAGVLIFVGIGLLLSNRRRLQRLVNWARTLQKSVRTKK